MKERDTPTEALTGLKLVQAARARLHARQTLRELFTDLSPFILRFAWSYFKESHSEDDGGEDGSCALKSPIVDFHTLVSIVVEEVEFDDGLQLCEILLEVPAFLVLLEDKDSGDSNLFEQYFAPDIQGNEYFRLRTKHWKESDPNHAAKGLTREFVADVLAGIIVPAEPIRSADYGIEAITALLIKWQLFSELRSQGLSSLINDSYICPFDE